LSKIKVAILGSGFGQKVITPAIEKIEDFEIVKGHSCSNIDLLVKDKNVDAVVLALPPLIQCQIAPLLKDKHLFLEKPLSANLKDALKIQKIFKNSDKKIMVDFSYRFVDAFQKFKELIKDKNIDCVDIKWLLNTKIDQSLIWNWKDDLKSGGGAVNLLGSHIFDYIIWLFEDIDYIKCYKNISIKQRFHTLSCKNKEVTSDDSFECLVMLKNKIVVHIDVSTVSSVKTPHFIKAWCKKELFELSNQKNSDYYDEFSIKIDNIEKYTFNSCTRIDIIKKSLITFAKVIRGKEENYPTLEDGIKVQRLLKNINGF